MYGIGLVVVISGIGAGAYWWYTQPRTAEIAYQPCRIEYGTVVAEWEGTDRDAPWNDANHHYQLRRFSLRATAPDVFFPNTIESPPTRIATGGEDTCKNEFDETVDVAAERYRWHGARTTALRLGRPSSAPLPGAVRMPEVAKPADPGLKVPTLGKPRSAAVWVDDGGSASLSHDGQRQQWWCINAPGCGSIAGQRHNAQVARGAGYQYVPDNCPPGISCHGNWRDGKGTPRVIGRTHGMLQPFDMRLSAVSTYADTVGAAVLVTFKYPEQTTIQTSLTGTPGSIAPGASFETDLTLHKKGPAVDSLTVKADTTGHPIRNKEPVRLTRSQISRLNTADTVQLPVRFRLSDEAQSGMCHSIPLTIAKVEADTSLANPEVAYCVAAEETRIQYQVRTRGAIDTNTETFKTQVAHTLRDSRGWTAANITFDRVANGGDFTLWLASADAVSDFSSGCSPQYSCRVGSNVIINDTRWQNATPAWNQAGGGLRNYRHMVINHEVGHFLGLGHRSCPGAGQAAPIMMQQSIDLDGCRFNPWPLPGELERI